MAQSSRVETLTISWKQLSAIAGVVASMMGAATFVHAEMIVPAILAKAAENTEGRIKDYMGAHLQQTHPGGVSSRELQLVLKILENMQGQLDRIETQK